MSSFQQNIIKHKLGLLNLAVELGNVFRACKVMDFSRDTLYRYQAVVETALEQPTFGQVCVSSELRKRAIFVSPSGVRSVFWSRSRSVC